MRFVWNPAMILNWQMGGKMGSWDGLGWAVERLMGSFGGEGEEKRGGWGEEEGVTKGGGEALDKKKERGLGRFVSC